MRKRITFGCVEGDIESLFEGEFERYSFEKVSTETGRIFGEYHYESEALFGSPTTIDDKFVYDTRTNLLGLVQESDRPKPGKMFRDLTEDDSTALTISAPEYPPEASHQFYRTYGGNGYTTSFRDDLREYTLDSSFNYAEPEEIAKERTNSTRQTMSENLVEEVTEELIDNNMYVALMDVTLQENGDVLRFSNPMSVSGIRKDNFNNSRLHLICDRMQELVEDNVKSVEEVLAET